MNLLKKFVSFVAATAKAILAWIWNFVVEPLKKIATAPTVKSAWQALLKAALTALLATLGVASLGGCREFQTPSSKTQSSSVYAFGLPAIVVTHDNTRVADCSGDDRNTASAPAR